MKNSIIYIYGWNSSPQSNTFKTLKQLLPDHNLFCVEYDQQNPLQAIEFFDQLIIDQYNNNNNINTIIASSYGAFVALNINHSIRKFLINPCLLPSVEIIKANYVSYDFYFQCKKLETNKIIDDEDIRFTTAFFSTDDELFSHKNRYLELGYSKFIDLPNEKHILSQDGLKIVSSYMS